MNKTMDEIEEALALAEDFSLHEYMYHGLKRRIYELHELHELSGTVPKGVDRKLQYAQDWLGFACMNQTDKNPNTKGTAYWLYHVRGAIREAHQILQDAGV